MSQNKQILFDKLKKENKNWAKGVVDANIVYDIRNPKNNGGLGIDQNEENAIFRKEIARIYEFLNLINNNFVQSIEFQKYNDGVEEKKSKIKKALND